MHNLYRAKIKNIIGIGNGFSSKCNIIDVTSFIYVYKKVYANVKILY